MPGMRKMVVSIVGVVCCTAVAVAGLFRDVDPVGLSALITATSAPVAWFIVGSIGEWNARRHDQSTIAAQTAAARGETS